MTANRSSDTALRFVRRAARVALLVPCVGLLARCDAPPPSGPAPLAAPGAARQVLGGGDGGAPLGSPRATGPVAGPVPNDGP